MFEKLRVIFTIPELRQKILLTLFFLAVYRIGWHVPLPITDINKTLPDTGGFAGMLDQLSIFSASSLGQATIFGLGIMPYISASIIFQLLASVWGPLERLQKEGESGRKKINEYTRYATVVICLFQSWVYISVLAGAGIVRESFLTGGAGGSLPFGWQLICVITMTCGTIFLMWLGEQIDQYGIGNGISLLIMAGILARMPEALIKLFTPLVTEGVQLSGDSTTVGIDKIIVLAAFFVAVVAGVVFVSRGQRQIPTQSAKHVRGTKVYGGTRQYLPLRVNQAGVMPIIFASSLLLFPSMIFSQIANWGVAGPWQSLAQEFERGSSLLYNLLYVGMIYFFCYFWTAITFNPKDIANNLKDHGSFIPGLRPGRRTSEYLEKVMLRITYVGAGFLAAIAIIPTVVAEFMSIDLALASFYGGTSLLIAVSVAFDFVQKVDSHLVMRNYRGLLEG
ncbi:MAG: preprotein translocase subunit SecY [Pirellulales bacterium]|nr:preprotein translocase subunit SecY [Pirellulales bacterium]